MKFVLIHSKSSLDKKIEEGKRLKELKKDLEQSFRNTLLTSIIGILMCMICIAGGSWAWFTTTVTSDDCEIIASNFNGNVTVKISSEDGEDLELSEDGKSAALTKGTKYYVTLTAEGTASGYAKVTFEDADQNSETYYSAPMKNTEDTTLNAKKTITFSVISESNDITMSVVFVMGSYINEPTLLSEYVIQ